MSSYDLSTAPNGLHIVQVPRPATEAVTVQFFFRAGSRYETPATNGLAHFTEHMVFKGGAHYPTFQAVNEAVNQVGGFFNAYTSDDVTAFYVKAAGDKAEVALDVLSDILTEPVYDQAELDKERGVIIEEINMYEDDPASQLPVLLDATMYPGHPLGRPILGPKKNIETFPRDFFATYTRDYLTPDRAVLAITGKLEAVTEELLAKYVGRFSGRSAAEHESAPSPHASPQFGLKNRKTEQTHLGLSLRGPSLRERDKTVKLEVLAMLLGGNSSSRLFTEVREKQGLAYAVHASTEQMVDVGSLDVYAGVTNEKAGQAMESIMTELKRLRDGDLTDKEVTIAKESLKGMRALRWEDSSALGTLYGLQQLLMDEIRTPAEILAEVEEVTKADVVAMAGELVRDSHLHVAVVGPQKAGTFTKHLTFG